jgi:hypothetical protein
MRSAGKLMQSVYGDAAAQTNVNVTNNAAYVVCDEATRAKLIAMREALQAPKQVASTAAMAAESLDISRQLTAPKQAQVIEENVTQ